MSQISSSGTGGGGGNTITAAGQTVGAQTITLYTFDMGTTPRTVVVFIEASAFESTAPASAGYDVFGTFRTDGTAATIVGSDSTTFQEDASLADCDIICTASSNSLLIQAVGTTGLTVNFSINASFTST